MEQTITYVFYAAMATWIVVSLWVIVSGLRDRSVVATSIAIVGAIALTAAAFFTYENLKGTPRWSSLPEHFTLSAFAIDEPNTIYLWVFPRGEDVPIAYAIPYTRRGHQDLMEAREAMRQGSVVEGEGDHGGTHDGTTTPGFRLHELVVPPGIPKTEGG